MKMAERFLKGKKKHCGKRRNCSLRAIAPFPTLFSKGLYGRHDKPGLVRERVNSLLDVKLQVAKMGESFLDIVEKHSGKMRKCEI